MVWRHLWRNQKAIRTCLKAQSIRNKVGKLFHGSFRLNCFIFDLKSLHLIFETCLQFNLCILLFFFQLHPAEHRLLGSFRRPRPLVIEDRLKTCKTLLLPNNGGASDQAGWFWSEMLAPEKCQIYKNASNWCSGNMGDVVAPDFTEPESLSLSHLCQHDISRISAWYLMQRLSLLKFLMTWSPTSDLTLISFEKSIMVMTKKCKSTKKELLCKR